MKKVLMFFAAAALTLAACNPKEQPKDPSKDPSTDPSKDPGQTEEKLDVALTRNNFDIAGEFDYDITINGKTATIQLAYEDREEAQALDLEFINLPKDVEADYTNPYDYSDGKTQEIVFKKAGSTDSSKWDKWTVGVSVAAEIPHFVELTVDGIEIIHAEQTIMMSSGVDLTKLVVEYVVSPEGSVVKADGVAIESGAEVDFSDMLNGVVITVEGGVETYTVKIETSGISGIEKVWGYSWASDGGDWYGNCYQGVFDHNDRNVALDNKYAYLSASTGASKDFGIYAIDLSDSRNVIRLSTEGMATDACAHPVSDINVISDGNSTKLLVSNLTTASGHHLRLYSYDNPTSSPVLFMDYALTSTARFGDKFQVIGDLSSGELVFFDSASRNTVYVFTISNGVVDVANPLILKADTTLGNNVSGCYKYSDTEYMYAGNSLDPIVFRREGNNLVTAYVTDMRYSVHGINFFEFNGQKYMTWMKFIDTQTNAELRIGALYFDTLAESLEKNDFTEHTIVRKLSEENSSYQNGNQAGDIDIRVIDGTTYVLANACGTGISLFKLK